MSSENNKQIGDYLLNEEIGSGGFAKVVLGIHIPTGEKVAIKIMDKQQILSDELNKERVLSEISILKIVRHNNIIKLYEVMETPQKIYLVMEYCDGGELFDYIVSKQHLSEKQACVFFQELIDALTYLHSQNIVHRDVKPENILLESSGKSLTCKLIDFGISRTYTLDKLITTPCGTASYAPPEMHRGEEYYGLLSDVWSAGVLLYAMAFGYLPFCEEDEDTNIDNIIKGNYEIPEEASPELNDFLLHILDIDPLSRYDLEQIKKHPWYNLVTPVKSLPGIIIGHHKIPIDDRILNVCEAYGFNKDEVMESVKDNKYDNKSSIYYIILNKMKREGYDSISDLYSEDYLEYIKNPDNIIKKEDNENTNNAEEEKKEEKKEEEKEEIKEEKKEELTTLNDVITPNDNNKDNTEEKLINPELSQISTENKLKPNKSEAEISVASENSKKKNNENNSYNSTPKRKDSNNLSLGKKSRSNSSVESPKKEEAVNRQNSNNSLKDNEVKEEENKPLETLSQKIVEEPNVNKEEENKNNNNEIVTEKPETTVENIEIQANEPEIKEEQPIIITQEKEEVNLNQDVNVQQDEEKLDNDETNKENEQIVNPTVEEIIKDNNVNVKENEEINKTEQETIPSIPTETQTEKENENIPSIPIQVQTETEENKEPLITLTEKINPEKENIVEIENKPEVEENKPQENKQEEIKTEEIKVEEIKVEENKPEEIKAEEIKVEENKPKEIKTEEIKPVENKEEEIKVEENKPEEQKQIEPKKVEEIQKEEKPLEINKEKENPIEQIEKKESILQPEIPVSNVQRPKINKLSYSIMPKHSFLIINARKRLSFNIDEDENNKLNSSFTMKLSDDLKENVLKMRNPKMKNPNKQKEINKALQEIKQKKSGVPGTKTKKDIPKTKVKKIPKISNEPLFKENKRKEHTIIRNRNASAVHIEKKKNNNDDNEKNKKKKDISTSMAKIDTKKINNAYNVDLKNNIKKIKKDKDKDKDNEESKKRNICMIKKNSKDDKNKKSTVNIKKNNIPKPNTSTIKKSESATGSYVLNTTSNIKPIHPRKNASIKKKNVLKTPSKNLDKTSFEPIYHKINSTNANNTNTDINKSEIQQPGILNKTIQLSDVKKSNKKNKIPFDKNSNKKYKKNIRIAFKNIEEEDIDIDNDDNNKTTTGINLSKSKSHKVNVTFTVNNNTNNNNESNKINKIPVSNKKKVNHNKSNSMRGNKNNNINGYILTQNNDNLMSHRNLNNYQRSVSRPHDGDINKNKNRYQSIVKTERNTEKTKKFLNISAYEGTKTEITSEKNGNSKFLNNNNTKKNKIGKNVKNNYYGPIDIKNIVIGNSPDEVNERLIDILHRNRVKFWKLNQFKFYCNKNGEIFVIEIFILSNKIIINEEKQKHKDDNEISEFNINNKNENEEKQENKDNNKSKMIFYITILSKDSSNKAQAKNINKIINKKFGEIYKK